MEAAVRMKKWARSGRLAVLVLTSCAALLFFGPAEAADASRLALNDAERAWLTAHPQLTFCYTDAFPPGLYLDKNQQPVGYVPDIFRLLSDRLGISIRIRVLPWHEAIAAARERRCAGLAMVRKLDVWRDDFLLSDRIGSNYLFIYARSDQAAPARQLSELHGRRVAYLKGEAMSQDLLAKHPQISGLPQERVEGAIAALMGGQVEAIIGSIGVELERRKSSNLGYRIAAQIIESKADTVIAVRKDWPQLVALFNRALGELSEAQQLALSRRWYADFNIDAAARIDLSDAEKSWLAQGQTVRVRVSDWPPYMFTQPTPSGISVDYLNLIAAHLGFRVEYIPDTIGWAASMDDVREKRQYYDLLLTMSRTPRRELEFALTGDYLVSPWVVFARKGSPFINGLEGLTGKTVAVEKGFVIADRLKTDFPAIRLLEVGRSTEALQAVATGQADAYVGNLTNGSYLIREQQLDNLAVVAPTSFGNHSNAMAVRSDWRELAALIDKGFAALSAEERNAIARKWGSVEFAPRVNYTLILWVAMIGSLILLVVLYWNWTLRIERTRTQRYLEESIHAKRLAEAATDAAEVAKDAAVAASRAKSSFLANMSHELRTPMNGIMGMTQLALRHAGDPKLRDQLGKVIQSAQHLLHIINDILDLSKIEAERLTLEKVEFRLQRIIDDVISLIGPKAQEKQLELSLDLTPELAHMSLLGDAMRLQQILLNLAGNAIKFTDRGSISVRARVIEEFPAQVLLRCEIRDSGIGIDGEVQKRLFSAFVQADDSMTRKYGGSGLGLAISKRLVEMMGGQIGVESEAGQGSNFWFTLRLDKAPQEEVVAAQLGEPFSAEEEIRARHRGARILLADDEPINQEIARGLLDDAGLQVDLAGDGALAVAMARQRRYALLLMDMQMPNLNGVDATRAIRALPAYADVPILAMTASALSVDRQLCLDAGMNEHIAKPIAPEILFTTVLKWLDHAARRRDNRAPTG